MSPRPRPRRQRPRENDLGLVEFLSEAELDASTTPSRPWPAVAADIAGQSSGDHAPTLLPTVNDDFASEDPLPHGSAVGPDIVPVRGAAARSAAPTARRRVITFGVYAMLAVGGAALGWFAGGFGGTVPPEAANVDLAPSASTEPAALAALRLPVRGGSARPTNAAPEERADAREGRLVAPPPVSAPAAIARTAPSAPPIISPAATRPGAAAIVATPDVPKPEPPRPETSPPTSVPPEALRSEAPRSEAPRAKTPRAETARAETPRAATPRAEAPRDVTSAPELPRAETARRHETGLIETVLDRYVGAFNTLDAAAARAVWPGVDVRALDRAFTQLEEQELTFEECRVELAEGSATAVCRGAARYVPRVGSRSSRSTPREWTFRLQKVEDRWSIDGVNVR